MAPVRDSDKVKVAVGLPIRPFFYTVDQIASMLQLPIAEVQLTLLWYLGRTTGIKSSDQMRCVNIADSAMPEQWRVAEDEFVNWLRRKGFRVFGVGGVR